MQLIVAALPEILPRVDAIRMDAPVFVFGLASPSLRACSPAWCRRGNDGLREGGRAAVVRSGSRTRASLVTAEIALAVVLLSAAGLLMQSFVRILATDPGFQAEGALSFMVRLPDSCWRSS